MATSGSTKVLILSYSFVRHLAMDLRWECVDRAVETFNVSGVDVRLYGVGGHTVQKLRNYRLYQVAKCRCRLIATSKIVIQMHQVFGS